MEEASVDKEVKRWAAANSLQGLLPVLVDNGFDTIAVIAQIDEG